MIIFNYTGKLKVLAGTILFVIMTSAAHPLKADNRQTLLFSASVGMPFSNSENTGFEDRLVKEIFRRIGYDVKIHFVPAERALINLNNGVDDGALGRTAGIKNLYPNVRLMKNKAFNRDFVVFSKNKTIEIQGWDSFEHHNLGYITGWKILDRNVKKAKSILKAQDGQQLFRLLQNDRVNVIIYNRWGGLHLIKDMGLKGIHLIEPPLASAPHYFGLNKKHSALLEAAEIAQREMKIDGTYQKIFDETLAPLKN